VVGQHEDRQFLRIVGCRAGHLHEDQGITRDVGPPPVPVRHDVRQPDIAPVVVVVAGAGHLVDLAFVGEAASTLRAGWPAASQNSG